MGCAPDCPVCAGIICRACGEKDGVQLAIGCPHDVREKHDGMPALEPIAESRANTKPMPPLPKPDEDPAAIQITLADRAVLAGWFDAVATLLRTHEEIELIARPVKKPTT